MRNGCADREVTRVLSVTLTYGLLICEVRNHNWYLVPGLTSMTVGQ
jgi:hypothetical protein